MRWKMSRHERLRADFKTASWLLRDPNLVWSADMESIREDLANYIDARAVLGASNNPYLVSVVQKLIADENDITIGD